MEGARFIAVLQDAGAPAASRARAAEQLGLRACAEATPFLIGSLTDPDPEVREAVAGALVRLREPRSEGALARALDTDPSPDVRSACAQALEAIGARAALARAADTEPDAFVVIFIERALWRLDGGRTRRPSRFATPGRGR